MPQFDPEDRENTPALSSVQQTIHHPPRRFEPSPEKSPLRDITTLGSKSAMGNGKAIEQPSYIDFDRELEREETHSGEDEYEQAVKSVKRAAEAVDLPVWGDVEMHGDDEDFEFGNRATSTEELPLRQSIEEDPGLFEQPSKARPTQANSRRKRKSEAIEEELNPISSPTPEAKRHKVTRKQTALASRHKSASATRRPSSEVPETAPVEKCRPLKSKTEAQLSISQQSELDGIIEKVKARPGQHKSLYILRRETTADDSITHTRSGRVSVKPLAYWRNERCVYGGSPGGAQLADGARFPLNSIREIVRTEELDHGIKKQRGGKRRKVKARKLLDDSDSDTDLDPPSIDPHVETWESERGIYRGATSVWDPTQQAPLEVEEEVDLAYAPAAMETREVKGSDFKYAKLLSTPFFGTGIVDLPPGTEKRPKNSRKMLMSFFVFSGRVTVEVGPYGLEQNVFSVGKGAFWTVPRGEFVRRCGKRRDVLIELQGISMGLRTSWISQRGFSSHKDASLLRSRRSDRWVLSWVN